MRVFASTQSLKDELDSHGFKRVVVTPLGVDTDLFTAVQNPPLKIPKKPIFLYAGRVAKEKSVEDFLECSLPGTKIIVGDGPERKRLEKKYPKDTLFLGYKSQEELVKWLSATDVFVFPSRTETFGLVILEALACNVPVAAYPVMGPLDIITNGVDGVLGENLEKAALDCLALSRENCRAKALEFTWEKAAEAFLENLEEINPSSA